MKAVKISLNSIDISKPIELNIHAESGIDEIMATLKPYLAE